MAVRGTRLLGARPLAALAAGGVLTGSLLLGGGTALAQTGTTPTTPTAPTPTGNTVAAQCGQNVAAQPGDRVMVTPAIGLPFSQLASSGMAPITKTLGGILCQVDVTIVEPVSGAAVAAVPTQLKGTVGSLGHSAGSALRPSAPPAAAPVMPVPMMPAAPPAAAPSALPAMSPEQLSASAPLFAPAFASLPSSFLAGAMAPGFEMPAAAPAGRMMDPSMLFGSAFPGLRAGAPAYLGYDPASAVTTASQVQALPVDGLPSSGGIGLPVLIAVLVLAGVAAFAVRRSVVGSKTVAAAGTPEEKAAPAAPAVATLATGSAGTKKKVAAPAAPAVEKIEVADVEKTVVGGREVVGTASA